MRQLLKQDLISGPAVNRECHLIAHGAGGKKKRRLLAQEIGDHVLQQIDGGVFALLLVSHFRLAHEPAHWWGGSGDGIAEQVDLHHSIISILRRPSRRGIIVAAAQITTTAAPCDDQLEGDADRLLRIALIPQIAPSPARPRS